MTAVPVVTWDATEAAWLAERRNGLGGSDIGACLGFSPHRSPWLVWAEKTGLKTWSDESTEATELGHALEPWLRERASIAVGVPVDLPEARTYAVPDYPWRRYSPDGVLKDGRLFEAKTAGLAGFGTPLGWDDGGLPLGYELQCRWGMYVMDAPAVELLALVAGHGVVHRRVRRDMAVERDLIAQVTTWWHTHVERGIEPALTALDRDALTRLYPHPTRAAGDLDATDAPELIRGYLRARTRERDARNTKRDLGAQLMALLGDTEVGRLAGEEAVSWSPRAGSVDWLALLEDYANATGVPAPNPESYRRPAGRVLRVRG